MSATGSLIAEDPGDGAPGDDRDADGLLAGLNAEQLHAVTTDGMPLAIRAGAGSGKTRVLTRRIAWRSLTGRNDPRRVLALTFTRKAAGQLRSRLRVLGLRDQVAAGTFHSVAYAQLRTYWRERDQREPDLLDRKFGFITPLLPRDRRSSTDVLDVVSEIEWAKARRIPPEAYTGRAEALGRTPPMPPSTIGRIYREYEDLKAQKRMIDFDDLLDDPLVQIGDVDLNFIRYVKLIDMEAGVDIDTKGQLIWDCGFPGFANADVDAICAVNSTLNGTPGRPAVDFELDPATRLLTLTISDFNGLYQVKNGLSASINGVIIPFGALLPYFIITHIDSEQVTLLTGPVPASLERILVKVSATDGTGQVGGDAIFLP